MNGDHEAGGLSISLHPRISDRLLAVLGLIATSPILATAAVGIKLSGSGPVVYRAKRAGLHGRPFTMYKLRTMRNWSTPGEITLITGGADPRVFPWGRWLRRLKIDELPQLVNVIRGDMAIVGPRPEDPTIVERDYQPWMRETLSVLPGLTSPGSLDYFADESSLPADPTAAEAIYLRELLPRKIAADLVYVRHRSAAYDAALMLRTAVGVLGAHRLFTTTRMWELGEAERILDEEST